jgi:hypothetical protein
MFGVSYHILKIIEGDRKIQKNRQCVNCMLFFFLNKKARYAGLTF